MWVNGFVIVVYVGYWVNFVVIGVLLLEFEVVFDVGGIGKIV